MGFADYCRQAAASFAALPRTETLRLVSHHDADGISAAAIMVSALLRDNRRYALTIVPQLRRELIEQFAKEQHQVFVFCDLGSGQIEDIRELLADRQVYILDHHELQARPEGIWQVNPHCFGIDGGKEISGAGVAYLFARDLSAQNKDLAVIAIIGALGDIQEDKGFTGLNKAILADAVATGTMEVQQGLRFFGAQTRPLHKLLEYSMDYYIPGVSGNESGAIQFLTELGIDLRKGSGWKKAADLSKDDMKDLVAGIILRRHGEQHPEDIIGPVYILPQQKPGSSTRDAREFATLLNACGRLGKASLGIGALLGDKHLTMRALREVTIYRKKIMEAVRWTEEHVPAIERPGDANIIIIDGRGVIGHTVIGTVASIISRSGRFSEGTMVLGIADQEKLLKVSIRKAPRNSGSRPEEESKHKEERNLREFLAAVIADLNAKAGEDTQAEVGGHANAAGAQVPLERAELFVECVKERAEAIDR
ncbi:hypothetical protein AUJ68_06275 [Candidatus Woesearchaeota archaeon CG1_02_57_44]|nr:MAG: hypothetical protein AUJ68_06275 [Candidatus Woesearchaeota archaeon CG1_02_57_44]PIN70505.1 MAG: hypothetical protein COV94_01635 [Candidatus Woesearchaeota archaeon CG11_big_fil_rev_8_21_14_0_20_57_5]